MSLVSSALHILLLLVVSCRFEFTTPQGDHVAMSAAARRGAVYICGASMVADRWQGAGPIYGKVVKSFRIRTPLTTI